MKRATQRIRYVRTGDGVQLAWAEAGTGPVLIKASNWMTHLEYEWESPVWRHWIRFFSDHFRFVRHDERWCGMTDWNVGDLSFNHLESAKPWSAAGRPAAKDAARRNTHRWRSITNASSGARQASFVWFLQCSAPCPPIRGVSRPRL
jgi:hypothetical protein